MKILKYLLCIAVIQIAVIVKAQHFQFSQYNFTDLRINPALVCASDYAQLDMIYRKQSVAADASVQSTYLSGRYPLMTSQGRWAGIGVSFLDDRSGISGLFKTNRVGLSYAVAIPVTQSSFLSLGGQGIYQSQQFSLQGLTTGAQYIPNRGFDVGTTSGEALENYQKDFFTFSAGLHWQSNDRQNRKQAHFGFSFFDFNNPNEAFFSEESEVASTLSLNGGFRAAEKNGWSYYPELLLTHQAAGTILNLGMITSYDLSANRQLYNVEGKVNIVTKYVTGRYFIGGVQFEKDNFTVGFSYDIPIAKNVANTGAFEIGIQLRKLISPKQKSVKTRNRRTNKKVKAEKTKPKKSNKNVLVEEDNEKHKKVNKESVSSVETTETSIQDDSLAKTEENENTETKAKAGNLSHFPFTLEESTSIFNFGFNQKALRESDKKYLDGLIMVLRNSNHLKIRIIGHTDNVGSEVFNKTLSVERARTVKGYIMSQGINENRIEIEGKGEKFPVAGNTTETGRSKNRRVEFILRYK